MEWIHPLNWIMTPIHWLIIHAYLRSLRFHPAAILEDRLITWKKLHLSMLLSSPKIIHLPHPMSSPLCYNVTGCTLCCFNFSGRRYLSPRLLPFHSVDSSTQTFPILSYCKPGPSLPRSLVGQSTNRHFYLIILILLIVFAFHVAIIFDSSCVYY